MYEKEMIILTDYPSYLNWKENIRKLLCSIKLGAIELKYFE